MQGAVQVLRFTFTLPKRLCGRFVAFDFIYFMQLSRYLASQVCIQSVNGVCIQALTSLAETPEGRQTLQDHVDNVRMSQTVVNYIIIPY